MDQQSVETLLRRLVQRVEESERRYSEALADLHARLDQLSQATAAMRPNASDDDAKTFERLHDQVSSLAQRLECESNPLDDFERLGRALSGELGLGESGSGGLQAKPDLLSELASSSYRPSEPQSTAFTPSPLAAPYAAFPAHAFPEEDRDLDKRLVEIAHRLEHSITSALPATALEALNARLDEIAAQINQALGAGAKELSLAPLEQKIADVAAQLSRAEAQLEKVGAIETALSELIGRVDASAARLETAAEKAASEAVRRFADEVKLSAATAERLEAMHRDLLAMSERSREKDERLAGTIEAVHGSLKHLVQLMEQPPQPPKLKLPFAERMRRLEPQMPEPAPAESLPTAEMPPAVQTQAVPEATAVPRNRLAAALSELDQDEVASEFGRAKSDKVEKKEAEPKREERVRPAAKPGDAASATDDLIAAARRAAQAAALKAEQRSSSRFRRLAGDAETSSSAEAQPRRKRSFLIISAAILLVISALLLFTRLAWKPEPEAPQNPATESSVPPVTEPAAPEPNAAPAAKPSGASGLPRPIDANPAGEAVGAIGGNYTDVAKSLPGAVSETTSLVEPASIKSEAMPALPPGVVISIEGPAGPQAMAEPGGLAAPQNLRLPPAELGPLSLRQAAARGDARAQYAIALRYAQGDGTPQNLVEAARWFERAAGAGLAPAQYRLGAMYERGQGVPRDLGRARSWYQAAAEKGNVKAMHNLAVSLSSRENGGDYTAAAKWFAEAASYGLADSQFNLGILAEHGLGMAKNPADAYKWFSLAAKAGDAEAAKRRDAVKSQLDATALAEAEKAVASWAAKQAPAEANEVPETEDTALNSATPNTALVSRAQSLLKKLGYDVGTPDGLMGERTREAIRSFERKSGLKETGTVTVPLVTKLERAAG